MVAPTARGSPLLARRQKWRCRMVESSFSEGRCDRACSSAHLRSPAHCVSASRKQRCENLHWHLTNPILLSTPQKFHYGRPNYPLCPLLRRYCAQPCASDRFLWNFPLWSKNYNINFLRSGQKLSVPERKAWLCSFAACLFWTDPVSSCLWCTLTLVDVSVRHGNARHRSSLRMRPSNSGWGFYWATFLVELVSPEHF